MEAYLDHAASSPVRPQALEAMLPYLREQHGNPTGVHSWARRARRAVDDAREVVAAFVGRSPAEVVFTSGGTEADDLAISGVLDAVGGTAVCTAVEHHAVADVVLRKGGLMAPVHSDATLDLTALEDLLANAGETITVVSVMAANNEVGTIQPLAQVREVMRRRAPEAVLHTDAVQAAAWLDLPSETSEADMISLSAHKLGGPKGVGVLTVSDRVRLSPRMVGGGQERDRRSGTHNVAGIVGMAAAAEAVMDEREAMSTAVRALRDRLLAGLTAIDGVTDTCASGGASPRRLPSICHVCITGVDSESLLFLADKEGIAASAATSCASGATEPSHVLEAMGVSAENARGALRLSLGWSTTEGEVDHALAVLPNAIERLRLLEAPPVVETAADAGA